MKVDTGKPGLWSVMALGLILAAPAGAQQPQNADSADRESAQAGELASPAAAQDGSDPPAASRRSEPIDEVIVTARRIEERLQDVPISMTVFNQEQLDRRNVFSGADLATYTPGLSANTRYGSDNALFAIRGFAQEIRTTASVGVYFADVVAARGGGSVPGGDGAGPGAFFDLQNVQVLKGPQGTLFGRNTTGGAVLLVPRKPTDQFEGYAEQSLGNFDMRRTQVVFNAPLSDWARLRLGADKQFREGYTDNISGIGPDHFDDIGYTALRASLVLDLADNIENYTITSSTDSSNNGPLPQVFAVDLEPVNGRPRGLSPFAAVQIARQAGGDYYTVQNQDPKAEVSLKHWQVINTTTWLANDNLTVKNIASYAELTNILRTELFGTNFYFPPPAGTAPLSFVNSRPPPGLSSSDQATISEELQLQGIAFDGRLNWQSGVYFERSKPVERSGSLSPQTISCTDSDNFQCRDVLGAAAGAEGFVGSLNNPEGSIEYNNLGVYAQGTYDFTEQFKGTVGVRYTRDKTEADTRLVVWRFPSENQPSPRCATNLFVEVSDVSECNRQFKTDSSAPTWVLGLDYKPVQDLLLYGKWSRGYRQGSISPFSGAIGFEEFDPEEVDTYELGLKTSFEAAVSGNFSIAAFYTDFTDQQILVGFSNTNNTIAPTATPLNAGKSRMYGFEAESQLRLFEGLTLDLSYAYLDTKLEELREIVLPENSAFDTVQLPTEPGDELTFSPKHSGSVTATYRFPLPTSIGEVYAGATYTYTSEQLQSKSSPFGVIPSYELVNANLVWASIFGGPVDLSLFGTNLLDKEYYTSIAGIWASGGFEARYPAPPRMFGLRARVNFGS